MMVLSRQTRLASALVRMAASQARIDYLAQTYPDVGLEVIQDAEKIDPTGDKGSYLDWIVNRINRNDIQWPEQKELVAKLLNEYHKLKSSSKSRKRFGINPDINKYSLVGLEGIFERAEAYHGNVRDAAKVVYDRSPFKVIMISADRAGLEPAIEAACLYGAGTGWCTKGEDHAKNYLGHGPLFVIYKNGKKVALANDFEVKDTQDEELDPGMHMDIYEVLGELGVISRAELGFRISESLGYERVPEYEPDIMRDPKLAFHYAFNTIQGPWPEAEPYIVKDAIAAKAYAFDVLGKEWPAAEPTIMKDPVAAVSYALHVRKRRWPEAEPYIVEDRLAWMNYVQHFHQEMVGGVKP